MKEYDLVIAGAGPAGISCAIAGKISGMNILLCDKGNIVESIINFPTMMTFFSTSDVLTLADIPFSSAEIRPKRIEAVKYYQNLINFFNIPVQTQTKVTAVKKMGDKFSIRCTTEKEKKTIKAKYVVIATGFYDNPNLLNIPGENLHHVSHFYSEPYKYFKKKVVVVGGKNSAVETALDLYRNGAEVTILHRRDKIQDSVKYWILPDIQNRIKEGAIKVFLNAEVTEIRKDSVIFRTSGKIKEIEANAVFLMTGYHPDTRLLEKCGVQCDPDTQEPKVNQSTFESNVSDLYIAGALLAGKNANRIFIENSREHGQRIVSAILGKTSGS